MTKTTKRPEVTLIVPDADNMTRLLTILPFLDPVNLSLKTGTDTITIELVRDYTFRELVIVLQAICPAGTAFSYDNDTMDIFYG